MLVNRANAFYPTTTFMYRGTLARVPNHGQMPLCSIRMAGSHRWVLAQLGHLMNLGMLYQYTLGAMV